MDYDKSDPNNKKALELGSGNAPTDSSRSDSPPGSFYSPDSQMDRGWVKNYRKIKEWEWYTKPNIAHLFQHLIREANHKDKRWQGMIIQRGQIAIGRESLSLETGLSVQQIRTCLKHLKKTGELTITSTNKFSIITICNYDKYQNPNEKINQHSNQQLTSNQPAINHKQELKNVKKNNICPNSEKLFDLFWLNYPRKEGKGAAKKAWKKIKNKPQVIEQIKIILPKQMSSHQWNKDNGQFIPMPATYLNQERWLDET